MSALELAMEAMSGRRGEAQKRLAETGLDWIRILLTKNNDYGNTIWEPPILAPEFEPGAAIRVRMSDKIDRLIHLLNGGSLEVTSESIDDTICDLGAYCLLYLARPKTGK